MIILSESSENVPLNLNHTSSPTSREAIAFFNLSQSSPGGIRKMNCSSKARSSSSESSSLSYCPKKDVPGAWDAALSLNLSLSLGWGLLLVLEDLVVRSELSIESGDGVEFLIREDPPKFRSATVLGREPARSDGESAAWIDVDGPDSFSSSTTMRSSPMICEGTWRKSLSKWPSGPPHWVTDSSDPSASPDTVLLDALILLIGPIPFLKKPSI